MAEMMKNPPPFLVDETCRRCDLFPTKPGNESAPSGIIAASNWASLFEARLEARIAVESDVEKLSARQVAALDAIKAGRARSDRNRTKKTGAENNPTTQPAANDRIQRMLMGGEGVMDD
jgi:hypothetical protein